MAKICQIIGLYSMAMATTLEMFVCCRTILLSMTYGFQSCKPCNIHTDADHKVRNWSVGCPFV